MAFDRPSGGDRIQCYSPVEQIKPLHRRFWSRRRKHVSISNKVTRSRHQLKNVLSRKIKWRSNKNMIKQRMFYVCICMSVRTHFLRLPKAMLKWMKTKWVVFQTHTIKLSNSNILLLQSHFLTDAIKFVKYKEKHRIYLPTPLLLLNSKQILWLTAWQ